MKNNQKKGVLIVVLCGLAWGLCGVFSQLLFRDSDMTAQWLVTARMLIAGITLLIFTFLSLGRRAGEILRVFRCKRDSLMLLIFALFGMLMMQYSYSKTIALSNAATATVLQYTYPVLMLMYTCIQQKKKPKASESIAVLSVFVGIVLIATHGELHSLKISPKTLVWGMISALAFVFYTVFPKELYRKYFDVGILGLSMLIGGGVGLFSTGCLEQRVHITPYVVGMTFLVMLSGCLLPLVLYGRGVALLGNVKASLFVTVEPVSSALICGIAGLATPVPMDIVGYALILIPVELLAIVTMKASPKQEL